MNRRFSDFILPYYSICLIVYSLTAIVYPTGFNSVLSSYFGIIISVVVLVYSITNGQAHYGTRIQKAENAMLNIKNLQRELKPDNVDEIKNKYNEIIKNVEFRDDVDFFRSVKQKCKRINKSWREVIKKEASENPDDSELSKIKEYFADISPRWLQFEIVIKYIFQGIIVCLPIVVLWICIIF